MMLWMWIPYVFGCVGCLAIVVVCGVGGLDGLAFLWMGVHEPV